MQSILPSAEDIEIVKSYDGPLSALGKAELFVLAIAKVSHAHHPLSPSRPLIHSSSALLSSSSSRSPRLPRAPSRSLALALSPFHFLSFGHSPPTLSLHGVTQVPRYMIRTKCMLIRANFDEKLAELREDVVAVQVAAQQTIESK